MKMGFNKHGDVCPLVSCAGTNSKANELPTQWSLGYSSEKDDSTLLMDTQGGGFISL